MKPLQRHFLRSGAIIVLLGACASTEDPDDAARPALGDDCAKTCSADGRSIVDCHGTVITTCGGARGSCFGGECAPACAAASSAQRSVGCEYYAARPAAFEYFRQEMHDASCYAVSVANTGDAPVAIEVEYDGQPIAPSYFRIPRGRGEKLVYELLPEGKLPSGEVAVLFLSMKPEQPKKVETDLDDVYIPCPESVGAAILEPTSVPFTGRGKTFHIRTSAPVVAYDIYPYGGARSFIASSSLLLPTSAWGTENLVVDGYALEEQAYPNTTTYFQVLATEDDTKVRIRPTSELDHLRNAPRVRAGEVGEFVLQRGEFLQFAQVQELNGTAVESDKPVSLVGGATCISIPAAFGDCDTLHQQLPSIRHLSHTYVASRFRDRDGPEEVPWLIMAAADDTRLAYDPPVPTAPATLRRGEWKEFMAPGPFVVRSQDEKHPFYVAVYMTGNKYTDTTLGDPEMVNIVPVGQYLSSYVFATDPTYGTTNLVFVRGMVNGKYEDVELECLGPIQGWQKVGGSEYEIANVDLVTVGIPNGRCDNGLNRASSKSPFALTVWGMDSAASYGFPAGMGTKVLNDIPALR